MKKLPLILTFVSLVAGSSVASAQHKRPAPEPKCYRHRLEQGGSPKHPTVLVCPIVVRGGK